MLIYAELVLQPVQLQYKCHLCCLIDTTVGNPVVSCSYSKVPYEPRVFRHWAVWSGDSSKLLLSCRTEQNGTFSRRAESKHVFVEGGKLRSVFGMGGVAPGAKVTSRVTLGELWGCLHYSGWLLTSGWMQRMYCGSCEVLQAADRENVVEFCSWPTHASVCFV